MFLVKEALPHLTASERAAIVNFVSAGVYAFSPYISLYVAANIAMVSMTRSIAAELVGRWIRANALEPGTTVSDAVRGRRSVGRASRNPARRRCQRSMISMVATTRVLGRSVVVPTARAR